MGAPPGTKQKIGEIEISTVQFSAPYDAWSSKKQKQFIKLYAKSLKKMSLPIAIPKFIIRLFFGEMSELIFNSQYVSSKKIIDLGFVFKFPKLKETLSNLVED